LRDSPKRHRTSTVDEELDFILNVDNEGKKGRPIMAMASLQPMPMPEPMNASPHHSKVKVSITLADRMVVAGGFVAGKVEMECRADKGLGIGVIMIELFATQGALSLCLDVVVLLTFYSRINLKRPLRHIDVHTQ
jgi:hypothetical protein